MKRFGIVLIMALLLVSCSKTSQFKVCNLTVERQDGTRALNTSQPRFSWNYSTDAENVFQKNYRIIVASTEEMAENGIGDLWDSGVIYSDRMLYIPYKGKALHSRDKAFWKVLSTLSYGNNKIVSIESEIKSFEISLLKSDDWQAKWIGHEFEDDILVGKTRLAARYLRKEFNLDKNIAQARLYVSGLGQYSAFINGVEVAPDELLKPALSDYRKRVYFNTFNVTEMLKNGENATGVARNDTFTRQRPQNKSGSNLNTLLLLSLR